MKFLHFVLCPWKCSSVFQFIVCRNLNRICICLLCENCINLNLSGIGSWYQLVHVCECVCAKSLQSCLTLCDPMDCSLPGSCPWDSLGKNTGVGCHVLLQEIFLTKRACIGRQVLYHQRHLGSPRVYCVLLLFCLFILLTFQFDIETPPKNLIST